MLRSRHRTGATGADDDFVVFSRIRRIARRID